MFIVRREFEKEKCFDMITFGVSEQHYLMKKQNILYNSLKNSTGTIFHVSYETTVFIFFPNYFVIIFVAIYS